MFTDHLKQKYRYIYKYMYIHNAVYKHNHREKGVKGIIEKC